MSALILVVDDEPDVADPVPSAIPQRYGDTINTAARLEAVNKQLGTRICVSVAAAERAPGFNGRPVGDLLLRGRSEPMRAFEPVWPGERIGRHTLAYAGTFAKLEANDPGGWPPSLRWSVKAHRTRSHSIT
jgi:hypothetical protein